MTTSIEEKYNRYMENVKKANKKYLETHREIVNEKYRQYYATKLAVNEDYKAKKRAYNRTLYLRKKQEATQSLGEIPQF